MNLRKTVLTTALAGLAVGAMAQGFPPGGPGGAGGPGRGGPIIGQMNAGPASADMLIMREDVRADLKLTDAQVKALDELRPAMRPPGRGGPTRVGGGFGPGGAGPGGSGQGGPGGPPRGGDPEAMRKSFEEMRKKQAEEVNRILNPEQRIRLKEIAIQLAGNAAITDSETQKALGVTGSQKAKIQELTKRQSEANRSVFEKAMDGEIDRSEVLGIIRRNGDALNVELGKILTAEQAAKLKSMGGRPFKATDQSGPRG